MPIDPRRTIADLEQLRALTANEQGAQRIAWTPTWQKARAWFQAKLAALPVEHHLDAASNSWTTLKGESEKTLILGSHLDSVPNGGWLDGCLGVLAGFEVLRGLAEDYHGRPPVTIRLVDWADEEGARFGRSLFGSSAFAGLTPSRLTAAAPTATASRWRMPCASARSMSSALAMPARNVARPPLTSNCTSNKGRC